MLEVIPPEPGQKRWKAICNYSSLDILQTCLRKAQYSLHMNLESKRPSAALTFGTAIHAAMETYYCAPRDSRRQSSAECDEFQLELLNANDHPTGHGSCVRCASVSSFLEEVKDMNVPSNDKRSKSNGLLILNNYFDEYHDDPYVVLRDDLGPLCERPVEMHIGIWEYGNFEVDLWYHGTIDMVFRNEDTNSVIVVDHKTTSSLGSDFYNRVKPNAQYTGYVMAAKQLGIETNNFMVNGIQVAKTVRKLARQMTHITDHEIHEFKQSLGWHVANYLRAVHGNFFPMSTPNPCTMWGGCQFHEVCQMPNPEVRDAILRDQFQERARDNASN